MVYPKPADLNSCDGRSGFIYSHVDSLLFQRHGWYQKSHPDRRSLCLQRRPGAPIETGQGGCGQNLRWLAYVPSESRAGRRITTLPAVPPRVMALHRGK